MNGKKQWNWVFPFAVLCLLLALFVNRWNYTASGTIIEKGNGFDLYDPSEVRHTCKWKTDRWINQCWIEIYTAESVQENPIPNEESAWRTRKIATGIWFVLAGFSAIWLIWAGILDPLSAQRPEKKDQEETTTL